MNAFRFPDKHGHATRRYGQSAFKIVTSGGKILLVDPWLTNPVFEKAKDELGALKHVDLIMVTHGYSDHVGDAVEIGKRGRNS
jgi:L-ascorbate metabolism protein UlaG (beta-lactamase superfamily)